MNKEITKTGRLVTIFVSTAVILCGVNSISGERGDDSSITFVVASCRTSVPIPDVSVSLVSKSGITIIGETDETGSVAVSRKVISESETIVVLFCKEGYFCSAIKYEKELFELEFYKIHLAHFAI